MRPRNRAAIVALFLALNGCGKSDNSAAPKEVWFTTQERKLDIPDRARAYFGSELRGADHYRFTIKRVHGHADLIVYLGDPNPQNIVTRKYDVREEVIEGDAPEGTTVTVELKGSGDKTLFDCKAEVRLTKSLLENAVAGVPKVGTKQTGFIAIKGVRRASKTKIAFDAVCESESPLGADSLSCELLDQTGKSLGFSGVRHKPLVLKVPTPCEVEDPRLLATASVVVGLQIRP